MASFKEIQKIMESESKEDKIRALGSLSQTNDHEILRLVISKLDDNDIQVRGEAFSSLLLNENDITASLIEGLKHQSKNIRGYAALALANRNSKKAIQDIIQLASDESAMVRSCAVGSLGYMRAVEATPAITKCLEDSNIEVKKSAIKSAIDTGNTDLLKCLHLTSDDPEIRYLLSLAKIE